MTVEIVQIKTWLLSDGDYEDFLEDAWHIMSHVGAKKDEVYVNLEAVSKEGEDE